MLSIQRREKMKNHSLHLQTINSFITVDCIPYLKVCNLGYFHIFNTNPLLEKWI